MKIITKISLLRKALAAHRKAGTRIGFVPTMGALHEGHLALVRRCRKENGLTVLSIFVNPSQFAPGEDYRSYPREKKADLLLAKKENVDIIFYPSVNEMYPGRDLTFVDAREVTATLCGASRPGHFRGVATVVAKLLNIVTPDRLYLGQKDAQQCVVLRQMIRDLHYAVDVRIVPTIREPDGLAMSSRNRYLTARQRQEAVVLYRALEQAKALIHAGERRAARVRAQMRRTITVSTAGRIDYIALVAAETLEPLTVLNGRVLIALAVKIGPARLIDNCLVKIK